MKAAALDGLKSGFDLPTRWREEVERCFVALVAFEGKELRVLGWSNPEAADALLLGSMI